MTQDPTLSINLRCSLSWKNAVRFPVQNHESRKDILIGALWLLVPVFGWLLNMGHRVRCVHRLQKGLSPWPAWEQPLELLKHGIYTSLGMMWYGWPGVSLIAVGLRYELQFVVMLGVILWLGAVVAIPGYMSHYCKNYDTTEIFNPFLALRRVSEGGKAYWKAWGIVLPNLCLSFIGVLGFGVGFLYTSVWFWQSAAFCFATVFTQNFNLDDHN